jgi:hypothetical protein
VRGEVQVSRRGRSRPAAAPRRTRTSLRTLTSRRSTCSAYSRSRVFSSHSRFAYSCRRNIPACGGRAIL